MDKILEDIKRLVEISKIKEVKNEIVKFAIKDSVIKLLEKEFGKHYEDYVFQLDVYAIKHIFKQHGDEKKEASRGQIAIKDADILLIFDVLQEPDLVIDTGKNKLGKDTITFIKQIEEKYVVVQEVREGRKTIALNSMRIFKTKRIKLS